MTNTSSSKFANDTQFCEVTETLRGVSSGTAWDIFCMGESKRPSRDQTHDLDFISTSLQLTKTKKKTTKKKHKEAESLMDLKKKAFILHT